MKMTYINNIPMAHGEVTVITAKNAEKVAIHACETASEIQRVGMGVLVINCGMSKKRFNEIEGKSMGETSPQPSPHKGEGVRRKGGEGVRRKNGEKIHLIVHSSVRGDLAGERDAIAQTVRECKIGVVIIAGWEWSSSSYRRKQRLLFNLRELMEDEDVAIVIYSQTRTKPVAGEYDRAGLGWLAMLAVMIIPMATSEELKDQVPKPPPIILNAKDMEAAERSAQLLASKINGLPGEKSGIGDRVSVVVKREMQKDKKPMKNGVKMEKKLI